MPRSGIRSPLSVAVAAVALGATLAVLLALRQIVGRFGTAIGPTEGDPFFTLYLLEWGASAWRNGLAGFWDAPFFFPAGAVITLSDHGLLLSLLHLALLSLNASDALAHNLLVVASFPLTAIGVFLLLQRATRAPPWAVALLALSVTFAPWRWGQMVHLFMLWAVGPPLAIWAFDRLLARPRAGRAAVFLGSYASAVLAGCYLAYLMHFSLCALLFVRVLRQRERWKLLRHWRLLLVSGAVAAGLAGAVFWPYIQARSELEERRRPEEIRAFAPVMSDWISPAKASLYKDLAPSSGIRDERDLFPGLFLSLAGLAGIGLWWARPRRGLPPTLLARGLLAAAAFFVMLTHSTFYLAVARFLPGLDGMRVTTRGQLFILIGVAVAGGRAAIEVRRIGRRNRRWVLATLAGVLLLGDIVVRPIPAESYFSPPAEAAPFGHVEWARSHGVRAVAILPLWGDWREAHRMLRWRTAGVRIANGYSSFLPPTFKYLRRECRSRDNRLTLRCIAGMREIGVTHVVVEDAWYADPGASIHARLGAARAAESLTAAPLAFSDTQALVFALASSPSGDAVP